MPPEIRVWESEVRGLHQTGGRLPELAELNRFSLSVHWIVNWIVLTEIIYVIGGQKSHLDCDIVQSGGAE